MAEKAGHFGILAKLLDAADLEDTLRGDGPFTVFAPTDEAFESLGKKTLSSLLESKNRDKLREILKYHVVAGRVTARDAVAAGEAKTLQGGTVPVSIKGGKVTIGPGVRPGDGPGSQQRDHPRDRQRSGPRPEEVSARVGGFPRGVGEAVACLSWIRPCDGSPRETPTPPGRASPATARWSGHWPRRETGGNRADAEDLVQEIFIDLWEECRPVRPSGGHGDHLCRHDRPPPPDRPAAEARASP